MSRRYPTVAQQEKALDEMKRILNRDITVMTGDEIIEPTAELLERVVLFEGILNMFNILEEKVTAGTMLAGKVKGTLDDLQITTPETIELYSQAEICLELLIGKEE